MKHIVVPNVNLVYSILSTTHLTTTDVRPWLYFSYKLNDAGHHDFGGYMYMSRQQWLFGVEHGWECRDYSDTLYSYGEEVYVTTPRR